MTDFHRLREQLQPFSLADTNARPAEAEEYNKFYGLDFEDRLGVESRMGSFQSGQLALCMHYWSPPQPAGTVFLVHGYFDHVGNYRHLIEYFLQKQYAVVSYDQPGHGLSGGEPAVIDDFGDYVAALTRCIELGRGTCPQPWHIVGQSMGGAVVMTYLLVDGYGPQDCPFQEVVLLAPLLYPAGWGWARWVHALTRGLVHTRRREFTVNSHDLEFMEFIRNRDPLHSAILPMRWVTALKRWIRKFVSLPASALRPMIIQGTDDNTVEWRDNLKVIAEKFPGLAIHYLVGARHHLVNESAEFRARMFALFDQRF